MAEKKASAGKKRTGSAKDNGSRAVPGKPRKEKEKDRSTAAERAVRDIAVEESGLPVRVLFAVLALFLFVLFLVVFLRPDGVLLQMVLTVVTGLVGKIGFYIAIPTLLYQFVLLAFSGKRPVRMRSACLAAFTFLSGCLGHIVLNPQGLPGGLELIGALWNGGVAGTSGGVLCGLVGMGLRWLLGSMFSYIVLIPCLVLLLLASFQVTVPGMIRAFRNRPRLEEEEEEPTPEPVDPSAVVVNHFAQKKIDRTRRRRQEQADALQKAPQTDLAGQAGGQNRDAERDFMSDFMSQVNTDPSAPLVGEGVLPEEKQPVVEPAPVESVPAEPAERPQKPQITAPDAADPKAETMPVQKKTPAKDTVDSAREVAREITENAGESQPEYCYPPIDLLRCPPKGATDGTEEMRENSRRLNDTLLSFKIDAHIVNVTRGPSVTRYEVELEKGVRLNKLTSCADDIALSLGASGVRIAAVPGKISVVGIEVPNRVVTTVTLREVLDSPEFKRSKSVSSFAVGKDIGGSCIVGNIAKLPHMLIAGTTGSGKSVCMNSIIISLLYKAGPENVKLIMVDPKMVELGIYNGIPQLLIPVVTDPKKAAGALQWAVTEMLRRYRVMSDAGVRDLESYNGIVDSQEMDGQHLPQIVVIIDELADLMLVAAKEVEEAVQRIAQMGRAAGIHLIIATQRPSADVITGVMKANIPSRIAFSVASAMESRIILDTQGAEKLVGKGDMLYAPIGCGKPMRVQGCFVTDAEVEAVAGYIKEHYAADYNDQIQAEIDRKAEQTGSKLSGSDALQDCDQEHDEMLPAAVDVLLESGQASVSMLQRRLKLGYARAARIVDEMEEMGIVGPFQGSKPREILITREQWQAMRADGAEQLAFADLPQEPPEEDAGADEVPFA